MSLDASTLVRMFRPFLVRVKDLGLCDFPYVDCVVNDKTELMKILTACATKHMLVLFDEERKMFYIPSLRLAILYEEQREEEQK